MKYDIVYACGHAGVIQIYGKSADRDRKIKWMETNCLCPNCQANENKKRTEIAIKEMAGLNLPTLTGSQKQIDWAVVIRAKRIEEAKIFLATNLPPEVQEKARKFYAWYTGQTQAAWWIDHRDEHPKATCRLERKSWDKQSKEERVDIDEYDEDL